MTTPIARNLVQNKHSKAKVGFQVHIRIKRNTSHEMTFVGINLDKICDFFAKRGDLRNLACLVNIVYVDIPIALNDTAAWPPG